MCEFSLYVSIGDYEVKLVVENFIIHPEEKPSFDSPGEAEDLELIDGYVVADFIPEDEIDCDVHRWCLYPDSFESVVEEMTYDDWMVALRSAKNIEEDHRVEALLSAKGLI